MNIRKIRALIVFVVAVAALGAYAPNASAWHFSPTGTAQCLQKIGDQCKIRISVTAVGFSTPAEIPATIYHTGSSYSVNVFTEDSTANTQTGQADYGQPTTFVNGINTFEVLVPCNLVKFYAIKHKDQTGITKIAINYNVEACKNAPPPPTPPTGPPVQGVGTPAPMPVVKWSNIAISSRCIKPGNNVGYKVYGQGISKVQWSWKERGKSKKRTTSNGKHYIKVPANRVSAVVTYADGSTRTLKATYKPTCVVKKPVYTG